MKHTHFVNGEFYHIYNRGVDKRNIFIDQHDVDRFFQSMKEFNSLKPIGSIYENSFKDKSKQLGRETSKLNDRLVSFVAYCLNPNHFHFILKQLVDGGISEFMKRMGGYTKYFNEKYKRSGALFQGTFKSKLIDSNEYLLHLNAYVNMNDRIHQLGRETSKLVRSSRGEYENFNSKKDPEVNFCNKNIILEQFQNIAEYNSFTKDVLKDVLDRKAEIVFKDLWLE